MTSTAATLLRSLATAGLLVFTVAATACETLDGKAERRLVTTEPTPARLEIVARFLDVNVTVASSNEVAIDASVFLETTGGNATAEREIEFLNVMVVHDGDKLVVRQGEPDKVWSFSGSYSGRGTISVAIPANVPFTVSTASGDVAIAGDFGPMALDVRTASGDIALSGVGASSAAIRTASGDGRLKMLRPLERLSWSSASGDLQFSGGSADSTIESSSGDLRVEGAAGPLSASSASGDVSVTFVPAASLLLSTTRLKASTASGDILLLLPSEVSPGGSLTTASGALRVSDTVLKEKSRRSVRLLGGGATVECTTASGDIQIKR